MPHQESRVRRFDAIFAEHVHKITEYCRWRSRCPADADDAVSEVFLTLWRRLDDVGDGDAARMWLYVTARRVTANQLRSIRRRAGLMQRMHAAPVAPGFEEKHDLDDPTSELVHAALAAVRPADREVLLLAEWEGLSSTEIARVLGCTQVSARGRLHRARKRFRAVFEASQDATASDRISAANAPTEYRPNFQVGSGGVERLVSEGAVTR